MSEKNRYSDEELEEFRALIDTKIQEAQNDLDLLNSAGLMLDANLAKLVTVLSLKPHHLPFKRLCTI